MKLSLFSLIATLTIPFFSCSTEHNAVIDNKSCINNWIVGYKLPLEICENDSEFLILQFYNNPYNLDSTYQIAVLLNNIPVYNGKFNSRIELTKPCDWGLISQILVRPGLIIQKEDRYCIANKDVNDFILRIDETSGKLLICCFSPEKKEPVDRFVFFQPF